MSYKVKDIIHENGRFWVLKTKDKYTVMVTGLTCSICESAYHLDGDGLTIAIARCNYLAKRYTEQSDIDKLFAKLNKA